MHVMNRVVVVGNAIAEGAAIGQISNIYPGTPAGYRHLHFEVQSALPPANSAPNFLWFPNSCLGTGWLRNSVSLLRAG